MTRKEFSEGFDTLVNSYRRFRGFDNKEATDSIEFNEHEKSFFLTKAQEEIIIELYTGKNPYGESFEVTEELRRYLESLIQEATRNPLTDSLISSVKGLDNGKSDDKHFYFQLPADLWFITYESVKLGNADDDCMDGKTLEVIPTRQDEYHRIRKNPFRGANRRRALRFDLSGNKVEIVCEYPVASYYVRYLKRLAPIVLEALPNNLTINTNGGPSDCEVHTALHQRILERAVNLGLRSKGYIFNNNNNRE
jgi:hypothetical protein